jgi:hypothetical protein
MEVLLIQDEIVRKRAIDQGQKGTYIIVYSRTRVDVWRIAL